MIAAGHAGRRARTRGRALAALVLLCLTAAVAAAPRAAAADRTTRFEHANAAFAAGDYGAARKGFSEILKDDGPSAPLLFNLGNASLRAGDIGEAVLSYERALLLAPRDQDIRANLRQARKAANLPIPEEDTWMRTVRLLTTNGWAWLASGALDALCGALLASRLLRGDARRAGVRRALRAVAASAATLLLVAGAACATRLRELDRAVVLGADPTLRVAPYPSATVSSDLAPGEIVRVERMHQGFALVRTGAGKSGWLSGDSVARIAQQNS
jgi:tetratricopeptide (TPR) repeat protein